MKKKQTMRAFIYLTMGLAMLFYALPRVPEITMSMEGAFIISWLSFAMLFIGANLYYLIGADRETQERQKRDRIRWLQQGWQELRQGYSRPVARSAKEEPRRRRMMQ